MITKLQKLEMLPGIKQGRSGQQSAESNEPRHFAKPIRGNRPRQARIIDALDGMKFGTFDGANAGHDANSSANVIGMSFSATLIFALRARGLAATSCSVGRITLRVSTFIKPSAARRRNSCFTMRSSSE